MIPIINRWNNKQKFTHEILEEMYKDEKFEKNQALKKVIQETHNKEAVT